MSESQTEVSMSLEIADISKQEYAQFDQYSHQAHLFQSKETSNGLTKPLMRYY